MASDRLFASFKNLGDALAFLAENLVRGDFEAIAGQCTDSLHDREHAIPRIPQQREFRSKAIQELGQRHAALSLRWRYLLRRFPKEASEFTLGGHDKELGYVHVDFVRSNGAWYLKEIWICR